LVSVSLFSISFASCLDSSIKDICTNKLPEYERKTENAVVALIPWTVQDEKEIAGGEISRDLAAFAGDVEYSQTGSQSVKKENAPPPLNQKDREVWGEWAIARMKEVQAYIDLIKEDRSKDQAREALSKLAVLFVTLTGYSHQGDGTKMTRTLREINLQTKKVQSILCRE